MKMMNEKPGNNPKKKKLVLRLCKGCNKELKNYNPYIYEDGSPVPLENIITIEVPVKECFNYETNLGIKTGTFIDA
jgi:hypothetical protein